uniref:Uncharacterized protein n=1 Tax=Arundo donax TaxID=35708 RepID=A0A0A9DLS2_ARUDO
MRQMFYVVTGIAGRIRLSEKVNIRSWHAEIVLLIHNTRFDVTTDAVGIQFFLKNVHPGIIASASALFGSPYSLHARPNTFGELMRAIISPSRAVQEAVEWYRSRYYFAYAHGDAKVWIIICLHELKETVVNCPYSL